MAYKSAAQRGLFHSPNSPVSPAEVAKWDAESKGQKGLPQHVRKGKSAKELFKRKKPNAS